MTPDLTVREKPSWVLSACVWLVSEWDYCVCATHCERKGVWVFMLKQCPPPPNPLILCLFHARTTFTDTSILCLHISSFFSFPHSPYRFSTHKLSLKVRGGPVRVHGKEKQGREGEKNKLFSLDGRQTFWKEMLDFLWNRLRGPLPFCDLLAFSVDGPSEWGPSPCWSSLYSTCLSHWLSSGGRAEVRKTT